MLERAGFAEDPFPRFTGVARPLFLLLVVAVLGRRAEPWAPRFCALGSPRGADGRVASGWTRRLPCVVLLFFERRVACGLSLPALATAVWRKERAASILELVVFALRELALPGRLEFAAGRVVRLAPGLLFCRCILIERSLRVLASETTRAPPLFLRAPFPQLCWGIARLLRSVRLRKLGVD